MLRVSFTSQSDNFPFCMKGGMFKLTPLCERSSPIINPLSAMTLSPTSNKSNNPDLIVNSTSDMLPAQSSETKVTDPNGLIPIKPFRVL